MSYRELFYFLVGSELKVRYRQAALVVVWAIVIRQYEFAKNVADRVLDDLSEKSSGADMST